jgi:hypothetical protein
MHGVMIVPQSLSFGLPLHMWSCSRIGGESLYKMALLLGKVVALTDYRHTPAVALFAIVNQPW